MRKGFTLIELAIALMVIGLILAMAMKGRTLVETAEIKSDINNVNKMTAAIVTFISKYNRLPGDEDGNGEFTMAEAFDELLSNGIINESDFTISVEGYTQYLQFLACDKAPMTLAGGVTGIRPASMDFTQYPHVCLVVSLDDPRANDGTSGVGLPDVAEFACYVETMLDDKNLSTGAGIGTPDPDYNFDNCAEAEEIYSYTYLVY